MRSFVKAIIASILTKFKLVIIRQDTLDELTIVRQTLDELNIKSKNLENFRRDIKFLGDLGDPKLKKIVSCLSLSRSQLLQDLFVLSRLEFKEDGFFVEFGATNGVDLSNTYLLEKSFGWKGILAEPAICWHEDLRKNRTCHIETNCVWKASNCRLAFNQTTGPEFSTLDDYSENDLHKVARENGKKYEVETISLNDLLHKFNAPRHIDYLSIDTEGSEYEILSNFDFSKYSFEVITCEHNYTPMREKIHSLLEGHGYRRIFVEMSSFDDWYVRRQYPPDSDRI